MEVAAKSTFVLPWANRRFPFSIVMLPFVLFLTPARPVIWSTLMGAAGCCALLGRMKGLKTSNRTANTTRLIPNTIWASFYAYPWRSRLLVFLQGARAKPLLHGVSWLGCVAFSTRWPP